MTGLRVGHGYDVHRLAQGRPLILGGVTIPWEKGLDDVAHDEVTIQMLMEARNVMDCRFTEQDGTILTSYIRKRPMIVSR